MTRGVYVGEHFFGIEAHWGRVSRSLSFLVGPVSVEVTHYPGCDDSAWHVGNYVGIRGFQMGVHLDREAS